MVVLDEMVGDPEPGQRALVVALEKETAAVRKQLRLENEYIGKISRYLLNWNLPSV
jgi:hypothetical protein